MIRRRCIIDDKEWKGLIYNGTDYSDQYLISNYGDVYSLKTKKILKKWINKNGYYQMCVSTGHKNDKMVIKPHMAVAQNFVDGYSEGLVVNHKDCNKLRNYYMNLEWVTNRENTLHAIQHGRHGRIRPVRCVETGDVFISVKEASIWAGLSWKSSSIPKQIFGWAKTAGRHPVTGQRLTWANA